MLVSNEKTINDIWFELKELLSNSSIDINRWNRNKEKIQKLNLKLEETIYHIGLSEIKDFEILSDKSKIYCPIAEMKEYELEPINNID